MVSILIVIIIILNTGAFGWTHECKEGEFRCNSSRICVPQERICNKIEDCPDKSDEKFCDDEDDDRSWNHLFRKHPAAELDEHSSGCELVNWTSSLCHCVGRAILCHNMGLVSPPPGLPQRGIQLLDLTGNFFPILSAQTMNLPSLQTLVLAHSGVKSILGGTFTNIRGLRALHLSNNQLKTLPESLFQPNNSLEILILRYNELSDLPKNAFLNLHRLLELDLRHNLLQDVKQDVLKPLAHLTILYLSENRLESIPRFGMLPALHELSLAHNRIAWIEPGSFSELPNLQHLYLSWNRLWLLKNKTFANLLKLRRLSLNENRISVLEKGAFLDLPQLTSLDLQRNLLKRLDSEVLRHLNNLEYIYFDEFKLCSAALHVRVCEPKGDGISSLQHLLDSIVLRASVWVMAVLACAGNTIVLLGRLVSREPNPVHSLYIKTLALADLLMGVYLLLIAAADWRYRDIYVQHEFQWRHSYTCSICGFLSTLSCEASVLILTLITRDRLVSVTRPLDRRQPSLRRATLLVVALWLVAAVIALLPLSSETVDYFGEEFYGGNGVCLPLHVQEPFAQGWEYSAAMFIVLNAVALVFISCAYWRMLRVVRSSGLSLRSTQERQDRAVAHRFVIIVATDCLCWIPVIGVKLAALAGAHVDQQLCAWLAVLVLPVNSALNPVLYTLTTSLFKNQMSRFLHAWKSRDAGPSHDSAASLSNMQLSIRKRHPTSQGRMAKTSEKKAGRTWGCRVNNDDDDVRESQSLDKICHSNPHDPARSGVTEAGNLSTMEFCKGLQCKQQLRSEARPMPVSD